MDQEKKVPKKGFYISGFIYGFSLFAIMELLIPFAQDEVFNWKRLSITFSLWMIMGVVFGYTNYRIAKKRKNI